jgi:hypothetical protein
MNADPTGPFPLVAALSKDGGSFPSVPTGFTEGPGRAAYRAQRVGTNLFLTAEGQVPNLQTIADFRQLPIMIFPPQFGLFFYTPNGIVLPALRPFRFTEQFGFPAGQASVVVHDVDGRHVVDVVDVQPGDSLPVAFAVDTGTELNKTGYGRSVQEAIDNAVAQLPVSNPNVADGFVSYVVREFGRFRGGFAGLDRHFARVEAKCGTAKP